MSMVATNVLRGGGAFLLSCYIRGGATSAAGPRPLLLKCNHHHHGNVPGVSAIVRRRPPIMNTVAESGRVYCTTATPNVVEDSSSSSSSSSGLSETSPPSSPSDDETTIKDIANSLDMRVGEIVKAWTHPEADTLYVEEVDVGEPEPRIICSGLVNYLPICHLPGKKVVVLANLKPRNMRGVKSYGMLMAASDASHENVELLLPPEDSLPGERVWFGSADEKERLPDAASPNQIQKKKIWELVQPHLKTDDSCVATLGMHFLRTSEGVVACNSLKNAKIS